MTHDPYGDPFGDQNGVLMISFECGTQGRTAGDIGDIGLNRSQTAALWRPDPTRAQPTSQGGRV